MAWELGVVQLPEDAEALAVPKHLTALHQPISNTKPEIRHIFVSAVGPPEDQGRGGSGAAAHSGS